MISPQRGEWRILAPFVFLLGMPLSPPALSGSATAPFVGKTLEDTVCEGDSVGNGSGPWDYMERASFEQRLRLTEDHHFTPQVEMLVRGQTSPKPTPDIIFTLTYWPNHHRALNSLSIYSRRAEAKGERLNPPAECWLQRAVNFNSKDATSRMLYAIFLHRSGHEEDAQEQYDTARKLAPQDMSIAYNYGLLLIDMENYNEANELAKKVYASGFPLPGLRRKLAEKGYPVP